MKKYSILLALLALSTGLMAQKGDTEKKPGSTDALLNALSTDSTKQADITFRSTRLILSQTTETIHRNTLNFMVIHRFGDFSGTNGGGQIFYGLDAVNDVYIGFEYGINDNLNVDLGRSTVGRLVNLDLKYALLKQTTDNSMPVSFTLYGGAAVNTYGVYTTFGDRMNYLAQAILSKTIAHRLSLQISPTYVDYTRPNPNVPGNKTNFFSVSAAARFKFAKHASVIVDYAHPFSDFRNNNSAFHDPLGFGIEVETGGHVFTINVTNSRSVYENSYLSNTQESYSAGQYRIGFTISRIFDFNHKSTYK